MRISGNYSCGWLLGMFSTYTIPTQYTVHVVMFLCCTENSSLVSKGAGLFLKLLFFYHTTLL
jgi:hypothetical protein